MRRRPATKVVVFQCPCGTLARSRSPFEARPHLRAMFVVAHVSSMKTSFSGSRSNWLSNQSSRRFMMSGRLCSLAWAVFFLNVRPQRSRNVHSVARLALTPRSASSRSKSSLMVKSGVALIRPSR